MNNKIGLYFQLEADDSRESLSMVRQALNRLEQLEEAGIDVQYFELRLKHLKELSLPKQASIKLDGNGQTFIDFGSSASWNEAFKHAFDRIQDQLEYQNKPYAPSLHYA